MPEPSPSQSAGTHARSIALVIDYDLDYLGGAQSAFLDQARVLGELGHHVVLVAPAPRAGGCPDGLPGSAAVLVPSSGVLPGVGLPIIRNGRGLRERLRAAFITHGVEIVHLHSEFGLSAAAVQVATELGVPTVSTVHTFFWQARVPALLGRPLALGVRSFIRYLRGRPVTVPPVDAALRAATRSMAQRATAVISPSQHQADRLRESGVSGIDVVPNAAALVAGDAQPLTTVELPLRIAWVGRLVAEKRILEFIEALGLVAARAGSGSLVVDIVGDGPLRAKAERAARALGAPARFHGRVERRQVGELMRAAHLVALTSYGFDNQPVTVVEAFAERRSVLYVDPRLKEGLADAGILSPSPTPSGIAEAILRLMRDPELVVEASQRTVEASAAFAPETHARHVSEIYERMLAGGR